MKLFVAVALLISSVGWADDQAVPFANCFGQSLTGQLFKAIAFDKAKPRAALDNLLSAKGPGFHSKQTSCNWHKQVIITSLRSDEEQTCKSVDYAISSSSEEGTLFCFEVALREHYSAKKRKMRNGGLLEDAAIGIGLTDLYVVKVEEESRILSKQKGCIKKVNADVFEIVEFEKQDLRSRHSNFLPNDEPKQPTLSVKRTVEINKDHQMCVPISEESELCKVSIDNCAPFFRIQNSDRMDANGIVNFVEKNASRMSCFSDYAREMYGFSKAWNGLPEEALVKPREYRAVSGFRSQNRACKSVYGKLLNEPWFKQKYLSGSPSASGRAPEAAR